MLIDWRSHPSSVMNCDNHWKVSTKMVLLAIWLCIISFSAKSVFSDGSIDFSQFFLKSKKKNNYLSDIEDDIEEDFTNRVIVPDSASSCGDRLTNQKLSMLAVEQNGVSQTESETMVAHLQDTEQRVRQLEEELSRVLGDFDKVKWVALDTGKIRVFLP